ncbi:GtrA family protein [Sphingomonas nostoxanthinifaciens]|uniref:GtrA family protein n=1 Tax=Sphingomonas nostoxanthinifaciens TaxID=2872652 RepID=UPI001CC1DD09|nr:GtrA family protein [Sphingomonas nostoxanthinifaciens]UAK24493.1 GtrA family protein [Sphingomonas nostoxanthinifaciens]
MTAAAARQETLWQLVRYGVNGGIVTSVYTLVFVLFDSFTHAPLQICNVAGYLVAATLGYVLHSRVTFRNHGERDAGSILRFALASLPGFAMNAFWTWLLGTALRWPHWTVQLPIWFVTPILIFGINRWWVFR